MTATPLTHVRTDPARLARHYTGALVLQAVVLALIVGLAVTIVATGAGALLLALAGLLVVAEVVQIVELVRQRARWRRTPVPLQLDPVGVVVDDGRERVAAPWAGVAQVRFETFVAADRVRIRFAPGFGSDRVQRKGMVLSAGTLDTGRAEIARLVAAYSAGRVSAR